MIVDIEETSMKLLYLFLTAKAIPTKHLLMIPFVIIGHLSVEITVLLFRDTVHSFCVVYLPLYTPC